MQKLILALAIFSMISCNQQQEPVEELRIESSENKDTSDNNKIDIALQFINGYNENCNKLNEALDPVSWVNTSNLATANFKSVLKKIIDEANVIDPEFGLEADPILDAQDNPTEGFELFSTDDETNYIVVQGIDWTEFKVTIKVIEENGNWLVDGCGMVNIPTDKKITK